jgi:hypothetical protein
MDLQKVLGLGADMADATWKEKLRGAWDLTFMFGLKGIVPFEKSTREQAFRAIWIFVALLPFDLLQAYLYPAEGLEKVPLPTVMLIEFSSDILGFVASFALMWVFASVLGSRDRFWITFQALIWTSIPMLIITLPFTYLAVAHVYPREEMERVFSVIGAYGAIFVSGCTVFRGLKISWEFAGCLVCFDYVLGTQIWHLLFWLNGVPIVWY